MDSPNKMLNLNSFLIYGYFMDWVNNDLVIDLNGINKEDYTYYTEEELIRLGSSIWVDSFKSQFKLNLKHCVPLSGGLDSRAILATLLEFTNASNINTYTFGTPGTWDYDIGSYIARKIGTKHINYDLTKESYSQDELEDVSKKVKQQTVLFWHPPIWKISRQFSDCEIWSGYVGDAVVGGHLPKIKLNSLDDVKKYYLKKYKYVSSMNISNIDTDSLVNFIRFEPISNFELSFEEQILFKERCDKFTAPHVLMEGFSYKTPFINNQLFKFFTSINDKYRLNQYLYRKILIRLYPYLFSLKTKTKNGLPLRASDLLVNIVKYINIVRSNLGSKSKSINYIDFDFYIREKKDLKRIIINNINDLAERQIIEWIDIKKILKDHLQNKGNYSDVLRVLVSLEIHLKTGKIL